MKRLLLMTIWFPTTAITLMVTLFFFSYRHQINAKGNSVTKTIQTVLSQKENYKMFVSLPKVLGISSSNIIAEDAVPEIVRQYLAKYKSPMLESSDQLINSARKYNIDPFLLVAIAQCESNLGKKMPPNCHNPFGWGIHSKGTLCFDSWEEGYEKVAKGLSEKYSHLLNSPEEMMKKYNVVSIENAGGSWAKCVKTFLEDLR